MSFQHSSVSLPTPIPTPSNALLSHPPIPPRALEGPRWKTGPNAPGRTPATRSNPASFFLEASARRISVAGNRRLSLSAKASMAFPWLKRAAFSTVAGDP